MAEIEERLYCKPPALRRVPSGWRVEARPRCAPHKAVYVEVRPIEAGPWKLDVSLQALPRKVDCQDKVAGAILTLSHHARPVLRGKRAGLYWIWKQPCQECQALWDKYRFHIIERLRFQTWDELCRYEHWVYSANRVGVSMACITVERTPLSRTIAVYPRCFGMSGSGEHVPKYVLRGKTVELWCERYARRFAGQVQRLEGEDAPD